MICPWRLLCNHKMAITVTKNCGSHSLSVSLSLSKNVQTHTHTYTQSKWLTTTQIKLSLKNRQKAATGYLVAVNAALRSCVCFLKVFFWMNSGWGGATDHWICLCSNWGLNCDVSFFCQMIYTYEIVRNEMNKEHQERDREVPVVGRSSYCPTSVWSSRRKAAHTSDRSHCPTIQGSVQKCFYNVILSFILQITLPKINHDRAKRWSKESFTFWDTRVLAFLSK